MPFLDRFAWLRGLSSLACIVLALLLPSWYLAVVLPLDLLQKQPVLGDVLLLAAFSCTFLGIAVFLAVQAVRGHRRRRERIFVLDHFTPSYAALATVLPDDARDDSDILLTIVWRTKGAGTLRRMLDYVTVSIGFGILALLALASLELAFAQLTSVTLARKGDLWPAIVATALFVPGSVLVMYGILMDRLYKPIAISATASGLRCQPFWGRSRFMPWAEMRLLETATYRVYRDSMWRYPKRYTLYSRDAAIRWNDNLTGRGAHAHLEQLLALIHDRTGLQPQRFNGTVDELRKIAASPSGSLLRQPNETEEPTLRTFTGNVVPSTGLSWQTAGITVGWVLYNVFTAVLAVLYPPTTMPLYNWLIVISLVPITIVMAYRTTVYHRQARTPGPLLNAGASSAVADVADIEDAGAESLEVRMLGYRISLIVASGSLALGMLMLIDALPPLDVWFFRGRYPGSASVFVPNGNQLVVALLLSLPAFAAIVLVISAIILIIWRPISVVLADDRRLIASIPLAEVTIPWDSVSSIAARRWLGRTRWYVVTADAEHTIRWPAGKLILPPPPTGDGIAAVSPDQFAEYVSQRTGLPIRSRGIL